MIEAMVHLGNRRAAIAEYDKLKGLLRAELDVDPLPETERASSCCSRAPDPGGPAVIGLMVGAQIYGIRSSPTQPCGGLRRDDRPGPTACTPYRRRRVRREAYCCAHLVAVRRSFAAAPSRTGR
jgi:hypothetical protein